MATELVTLQAIEQSGDLNPVQKTRLTELRAAGGQGNVYGIESPTGSFLEPSPAATPSTPSTSVGFTAPQAFDPVTAYESLYKTSGITEKQTQYSGMEKQYIDAKAKINDNPFLSEATRVGRVAKIEQLFNERTANIKSDIATSRADVEMKLNLELKRFDINSQAAKQAFDQFNSLLSSGALDNASGEDIANLTRSTGISSSMIQSAIGVSRVGKVKPEKPLDTQMMQFDDGTNQGFVVINQQTGEVINKQIVARSKPAKAAKGEGVPKPGSAGALSQGISQMTSKVTSRLNSYGDISPKDWQAALAAWTGAGFQKKDFVDNFGQYADRNRKDFLSAYGFKKPK